MIGEARINNGRSEHTRFIIIDSQSVKNTDTAENKGDDAGKKVSGIKRHLIVDSQGLPHGMLVTTANCTDRQGALDVMSQNQETLKHVEVVLVDGGYTGKAFSSAVQDLIGARVEVAKRSE